MRTRSPFHHTLSAVSTLRLVRSEDSTVCHFLGLTPQRGRFVYRFVLAFIRSNTANFRNITRAPLRSLLGPSLYVFLMVLFWVEPSSHEQPRKTFEARVDF